MGPLVIVRSEPPLGDKHALPPRITIYTFRSSTRRLLLAPAGACDRSGGGREDARIGMELKMPEYADWAYQETIGSISGVPVG